MRLNSMQLIRKAKTSDYCEKPLAKNLNVRVRRQLASMVHKVGLSDDGIFVPLLAEHFRPLWNHHDITETIFSIKKL